MKQVLIVGLFFIIFGNAEAAGLLGPSNYDEYMKTWKHEGREFEHLPKCLDPLNTLGNSNGHGAR